jgi:hypothetical protein
MHLLGAVASISAVAFGTIAVSRADVIEATPATYRAALKRLRPGDTLQLSPGSYRHLPVFDLNGNDDAWITIMGPVSGPAAVITGTPSANAVEIVNSSYVSIENLRIDSAGIPGSFGVSAKGADNFTHHIRLEANVFVGQGGGQQTDAISTKASTWGWVIRLNRIIGAGTGLYLGNSDGSAPFVAGVIENNLVMNTIGYNMEIKHQNSLDHLPGMPLGPTTTIIRNNVFIKDDRPSPDGDRPNLLLGPAPFTGDGSLNSYEVYGNLFVHNHREALLQSAGRVSVHDNVFVDGPTSYPAVVFRDHNGPLNAAYFYNNTVYTSGRGVYFGTRATIADSVVGNAIFAIAAIAGPIALQSNNIVDVPANAERYIRKPSFDLADMDFFPLPDRCTGPPIDLADFRTDAGFARDFNGRSKVQAKGEVVYRGAYAGDGENPGWKLAPAVKPPPPPVPPAAVDLVWMTPVSAGAGRTVQVVITGTNLDNAALEVTGAGVKAANVKSEATQVTASLVIAPDAVLGVRELRVRTPNGLSNPLSFRVGGAHR